MAEIEFSIDVDNLELIKQATTEAVARALETIGMQAESYAKLKLEEPKEHPGGDVRPNVDTGRLVNSITHAPIDETTMSVGTNVEYAPYVEMGTSKSRAYPYLEPAIVEHQQEYSDIVRETLSNA